MPKHTSTELQPINPVDYYQMATAGGLSYSAMCHGAAPVVVVRSGEALLGWLCRPRLEDCCSIIQGALLELAHRTDITCAAFAQRRDVLLRVASDLCQARRLLTLLERSLAAYNARQALEAAELDVIRRGQEG